MQSAWKIFWRYLSILTPRGCALTQKVLFRRRGRSWWGQTGSIWVWIGNRDRDSLGMRRDPARGSPLGTLVKAALQRLEGALGFQPFCPGGTAENSPGQAKRSPGNAQLYVPSPLGAKENGRVG